MSQFEINAHSPTSQDLRHSCQRQLVFEGDSVEIERALTDLGVVSAGATPS